MTYCIIRSVLDLRGFIKSHDVDVKEDEGVFYYHFPMTGRKLESYLSDTSLLASLVSDKCRDSGGMVLWREKELEYNFENSEDICFSQEYYSCKSAIASNIMQAILLVDNMDVFAFQPEIVGTYRDYEATGDIPIIFKTTYLDMIHSTNFRGMSFSSLDKFLQGTNILR